MKQVCPSCHKSRDAEEFVGFACGRCDKIVGDVDTALLLCLASEEIPPTRERPEVIE